MTSLELDALQLAISNNARVLYCIYLRPRVNIKDSLCTLNYSEILRLLNTKENVIQLGRHINALLKELNSAGLIELNPSQHLKHSLNKQVVSLPLITPVTRVENTTNKSSNNTNKQSIQDHLNMNIDWRPQTEVFEQVCQLVGVIDKGYSTEELGEYIAYWLGYPERKFTDYQWTQKFVLNIKLRRQRFPISKQQSKVGHQWVTLDASIEIDDNVRQLVEKYSEKK